MILITVSELEVLQSNVKEVLSPCHMRYLMRNKKHIKDKVLLVLFKTAIKNKRGPFFQNFQVSNIYGNGHCVKSVQIRSYFWSVFSSVRTEYGDFKINSMANQIVADFDCGLRCKSKHKFQDCLKILLLMLSEFN